MVTAPWVRGCNTRSQIPFGCSAEQLDVQPTELPAVEVDGGEVGR